MKHDPLHFGSCGQVIELYYSCKIIHGAYSNTFSDIARHHDLLCVKLLMEVDPETRVDTVQLYRRWADLVWRMTGRSWSSTYHTSVSRGSRSANSLLVGCLHKVNTGHGCFCKKVLV